MRVDHSRGRSSDKIRQAAAKQSGRTLLGQGREGRESSVSFYHHRFIHYLVPDRLSAVAGRDNPLFLNSRFYLKHSS